MNGLPVSPEPESEGIEVDFGMLGEVTSFQPKDDTQYKRGQNDSPVSLGGAATGPYVKAPADTFSKDPSQRAVSAPRIKRCEPGTSWMGNK
jgi:hypothetical protein